jgi:hypothetical protein
LGVEDEADTLRHPEKAEQNDQSDSPLNSEQSNEPKKLDSTIGEQPDLPATVKRLGAQISIDIGRIASQTGNSHLRSLVTQYLRLVSEFFKDDGAAAFPRPMMRHATNEEKCSSPTFGEVVSFHIGRAVLAYYSFEKGDYVQEDIDAVQFLHHLAIIGVGSHKVHGGPDRGYNLVPFENHDLLLES